MPREEKLCCGRWSQVKLTRPPAPVLTPRSTEPAPFRVSFHHKTCPSCPGPQDAELRQGQSYPVLSLPRAPSLGLGTNGAAKCWVMGRGTGRRPGGGEERGPLTPSLPAAQIPDCTFRGSCQAGDQPRNDPKAASIHEEGSVWTLAFDKAAPCHMACQPSGKLMRRQRLGGAEGAFGGESPSCGCCFPSIPTRRAAAGRGQSQAALREQVKEAGSRDLANTGP